MQYQIFKIVGNKKELLNVPLQPSSNHVLYTLQNIFNLSTLQYNKDNIYLIGNETYIVLPFLGTPLSVFKDKRGREWEIFEDMFYYDMICVRHKGDKNFNSQNSYHFYTYDDAYLFAYLLEMSS